MSDPTAKIVTTKEMRNEMSNFKLYLYTIDGDAVTSLVHIDDVEDFLIEHPDAVITNHR